MFERTPGEPFDGPGVFVCAQVYRCTILLKYLPVVTPLLTTRAYSQCPFVFVCVLYPGRQPIPAPDDQLQRCSHCNVLKRA